MMPARVYNEKLAGEILIAAARQYPKPIFNLVALGELVPLVKTTTFEEWRATLSRLEGEGKISFEKVFGNEEHSEGFLNLRITDAGLKQVVRQAGLHPSE